MDRYNILDFTLIPNRDAGDAAVRNAKKEADLCEVNLFWGALWDSNP